MALDIEWIDGGREPREKPNPDFPNGIDVDASGGVTPYCATPLPYPAKRCGHFVVHCTACDQRVVITTAGRRDDPRSFRMACADKLSNGNFGATGEFPKGKIRRDDEGALRIGIATDQVTSNVLINFGKSVKWIGLPRKEAIEFAETILKHARELKE